RRVAGPHRLRGHPRRAAAPRRDRVPRSGADGERRLRLQRLPDLPRDLHHRGDLHLVRGQRDRPHAADGADDGPARASDELIDGAVDAVNRLARRWPLGLASSSNPPVIELALELAGIAGLFRATVSSEEVARGKPAPDVYLEAARRMRVDPGACAAVEDSHN